LLAITVVAIAANPLVTSSATSLSAQGFTVLTQLADSVVDESTYVTFIDGASGAQDIETNATFRFNPDAGNETLSAPYFSGDGSSLTGLALSQFVSQTAWRVFYSNTDGDITELALGADGTFLKSNGAAAAPTFETPAGSGDFLADGSVPMTGDINLDGNNIDNGGVIFLKEQADADADVAGSGQIWVNTATPNELYFTDDAGTDVQLGVGGSDTQDLSIDSTNRVFTISLVDGGSVKFQSVDSSVVATQYDLDTLVANAIPITGGDAITITDGDIDFDGGATPAGELGGTWASPTIDDLFVINSDSDVMTGTLTVDGLISNTGMVQYQ